MSSAADKRERISKLDRSGLLDLWGDVKRGDTPGWHGGIAFEYLVIRAFEIEGADVRYPFEVAVFDRANTEQIDGAVYVDNLPPCLVEAKDHERSLNVEPLAKLRNQLLRRPGGIIGSVFATSGFTNAAVLLAQHMAPQWVLLWNGHEIERALTQGEMVEGLRLKYRMAVEEAIADYNLSERDAP